MENELEMRPEEIGVEVAVPDTSQNVLPLNYQKAFENYSPEEQAQIMALSDAIDVRKVENVMSYGATALNATFDQCGKFLKDESGSVADQQVIAQVIELSKKASNSYDDFNLVLQEPNLFQKIFLKVLSGGKKSRTQKIQKSAVTNYKLLIELKKSCDSWLEMLKAAMGEIENSAISDIETIELLEKYIIAGKLAENRIAGEIQAAEAMQQQTGLQKYNTELEELKEGFDLFNITMANLEKSRVMYWLSIGQLQLIKRSNRNVQISIHTQVDNSMALIGQQLRNAVLNAKNREVMEAQQAIIRLSDELIKDVARNVGLTAEESEKLIYTGFVSIEAAKEAVTTVIKTCNEIKKTATEMLPKMKADVTQLEGLIQELEPYTNGQTLESLKGNSQSKSTPSIGGKGLQF